MIHLVILKHNNVHKYDWVITTVKICNCVILDDGGGDYACRIVPTQ